MKELSIEKQIYLCKYHDVDSETHSYLGLTKEELETTLNKLKENGLYKQYRKLDEYKYYEIVKKENKHKKNNTQKKEEAVKQEESMELEVDSNIMMYVPVEKMYEYYYMLGYMDAQQGKEARSISL